MYPARDLELWWTVKGPVYVAGPMSGLPQFNFPAFDLATASLRAQGYEVISPAELDDPETRAAALASPDGSAASYGANGKDTWADYLARDVKIIGDHAVAIALLPGWERSKGAKLEAFVGIIKSQQFVFALFDPETYDITPVTREYVKEKIHANI